MGIFDKINFNNLPENFKEDSVREEIITPLLKTLGYEACNEQNRIIRSPKLQHPYIQFGTKSSKINIIPDYLIQVNNQNAFIVEAKAPSENIITGKNVEQAYSYAIHREVQVKRFVLCNGKEISIFETNKIEPILYYQLAEATYQNWSDLFELLSPLAFINPGIFKYKLDYGIYCLRTGIIPEQIQYFHNCYIIEIARLDDDNFTFMAIIKDLDLLAS